ncbi:Protein SRG1 [Dendrobium catenatum]|uniref:Protein SRG1 n=1 Tax=Dendrobium catenatum TaxID=906689 RepID=A0A2I0VEL2_9ASPA|nr:Protein SRG1 [Dendrobium catenatum]
MARWVSPIHALVAWWEMSLVFLYGARKHECEINQDPSGLDISPLVSASHDLNLAEDSGVQKVARELDNACKEAGFFYVKGHGIPDSLLNEVKNVVQNFFDLPYEEKVKIKLSPATGYRGYQRIGENITLGKQDIQEAIDCYRPMEPGEYGTLGETMEGQNLW